MKYTSCVLLVYLIVQVVVCKDQKIKSSRKSIIEHITDDSDGVNTRGDIPNTSPKNEASVKNVEVKDSKADVEKQSKTQGLDGGYVPGLTQEIFKDTDDSSDLIRHGIRSPGRPDEHYIIPEVNLINPDSSSYVERISGYFKAPEDGDYVFKLSSKPDGDLSISTRGEKENLKKYANIQEKQSILPGVYDRYENQKSPPITMKAGQMYYMEVLHKAADGPNHVQVGATFPDGSKHYPLESKFFFSPKDFKIETLADDTNTVSGSPINGEVKAGGGDGNAVEASHDAAPVTAKKQEKQHKMENTNFQGDKDAGKRAGTDTGQNSGLKAAADALEKSVEHLKRLKDKENKKENKTCGLRVRLYSANFRCAKRGGHVCKHAINAEEDHLVKLYPRGSATTFVLTKPGLTNQVNSASFELDGKPGYFLLKDGRKFIAARNDGSKAYATLSTFEIDNQEALIPGSYGIKLYDTTNSYVCHTPESFEVALNTPSPDCAFHIVPTQLDMNEHQPLCNEYCHDISDKEGSHLGLPIIKPGMNPASLITSHGKGLSTETVHILNALAHHAANNAEEKLTAKAQLISDAKFHTQQRLRAAQHFYDSQRPHQTMVNPHLNEGGNNHQQQFITLHFKNNVGTSGDIRIISTIKPEGYVLGSDIFKLKIVFKYKIVHIVTFHGVDESGKGRAILLNGKKEISLHPISNQDDYTVIYVTVAQPLDKGHRRIALDHIVTQVAGMDRPENPKKKDNPGRLTSAATNQTLADESQESADQKDDVPDIVEIAYDDDNAQKKTITEIHVGKDFDDDDSFDNILPKYTDLQPEPGLRIDEKSPSQAKSDIWNVTGNNTMTLERHVNITEDHTLSIQRQNMPQHNPIVNNATSLKNTVALNATKAEESTKKNLSNPPSTNVTKPKVSENTRAQSGDSSTVRINEKTKVNIEKGNTSQGMVTPQDSHLPRQNENVQLGKAEINAQKKTVTAVPNMIERAPVVAETDSLVKKKDLMDTIQALEENNYRAKLKTLKDFLREYTDKDNSQKERYEKWSSTHQHPNAWYYGVPVSGFRRSPIYRQNSYFYTESSPTDPVVIHDDESLGNIKRFITHPKINFQRQIEFHDDKRGEIPKPASARKKSSIDLKHRRQRRSLCQCDVNCDNGNDLQTCLRWCESECGTSSRNEHKKIRSRRSNAKYVDEESESQKALFDENITNEVETLNAVNEIEVETTDDDQEDIIGENIRKKGHISHKHRNEKSTDYETVVFQPKLTNEEYVTKSNIPTKRNIISYVKKNRQKSKIAHSKSRVPQETASVKRTSIPLKSSFGRVNPIMYRNDVGRMAISSYRYPNSNRRLIQSQYYNTPQQYYGNNYIPVQSQYSNMYTDPYSKPYSRTYQSLYQPSMENPAHSQYYYPNPSPTQAQYYAKTMIPSPAQYFNEYSNYQYYYHRPTNSQYYARNIVPQKPEETRNSVPSSILDTSKRIVTPVKYISDDNGSVSNSAGDKRTIDTSGNIPLKQKISNEKTSTVAAVRNVTFSAKGASQNMNPKIKPTNRRSMKLTVKSITFAPKNFSENRENSAKIKSLGNEHIKQKTTGKTSIIFLPKKTGKDNNNKNEPKTNTLQKTTERSSITFSPEKTDNNNNNNNGAKAKNIKLKSMDGEKGLIKTTERSITLSPKKNDNDKKNDKGMDTKQKLTPEKSFKTTEKDFAFSRKNAYNSNAKLVNEVSKNQISGHHHVEAAPAVIATGSKKSDVQASALNNDQVNISTVSQGNRSTNATQDAEIVSNVTKSNETKMTNADSNHESIIANDITSLSKNNGHDNTNQSKNNGNGVTNQSKNKGNDVTNLSKNNRNDITNLSKYGGNDITNQSKNNMTDNKSNITSDYHLVKKYSKFVSFLSKISNSAISMMSKSGIPFYVKSHKKEISGGKRNVNSSHENEEKPTTTNRNLNSSNKNEEKPATTNRNLNSSNKNEEKPATANRKNDTLTDLKETFEKFLNHEEEDNPEEASTTVVVVEKGKVKKNVTKTGDGKSKVKNKKGDEEEKGTEMASNSHKSNFFGTNITQEDAADIETLNDDGNDDEKKKTTALEQAKLEIEKEENEREDLHHKLDNGTENVIFDKDVSSLFYLHNGKDLLSHKNSSGILKELNDGKELNGKSILNNTKTLLIKPNNASETVIVTTGNGKVQMKKLREDKHALDKLHTPKEIEAVYTDRVSNAKQGLRANDDEYNELLSPYKPYINRDTVDGDWFDSGFQPDTKTKQDIKMSKSGFLDQLLAKQKVVGVRTKTKKVLPTSKQVEDKIKNIVKAAEKTEQSELQSLIKESIGTALTDEAANIPLNIQNSYKNSSDLAAQDADAGTDASKMKGDGTDFERVLTDYKDDFALGEQESNGNLFDDAAEKGDIMKELKDHDQQEINALKTDLEGSVDQKEKSHMFKNFTEYLDLEEIAQKKRVRQINASAPYITKGNKFMEGERRAVKETSDEIFPTIKGQNYRKHQLETSKDQSVFDEIKQKWQKIKEQNKNIVEDEDEKINDEINRQSHNKEEKTENDEEEHKNKNIDLLSQYFKEIDSAQNENNNGKEMKTRQEKRQKKIKATLAMINDIESQIDGMIHSSDKSETIVSMKRGNAAVFTELVHPKPKEQKTNEEEEHRNDENEVKITKKMKQRRKKGPKTRRVYSKGRITEIGEEDKADGAIEEGEEELEDGDDHSEEEDNSEAERRRNRHWKQHQNVEDENEDEDVEISKKPVHLAGTSRHHKNFVRQSNSQYRQRTNQRGEHVDGTSIANVIASKDRKVRQQQADELMTLQKQEVKDDLLRLKEVTQDGLQSMFAKAVAKQQKFMNDIEGPPDNQMEMVTRDQLQDDPSNDRIVGVLGDQTLPYEPGQVDLRNNYNDYSKGSYDDDYGNEDNISSRKSHILNELIRGERYDDEVVDPESVNEEENGDEDYYDEDDRRRRTV